MISLTIGGLGLFLLGMSLMTEGLKLAGGRTLSYVLERWTATHLRAFFTGFIATALVQSSSAITVSVIGFVNAGLLNLRQSMWVVFGSNVGTTMTAWIVALIGLKLQVDVVALPAIGIGTMFHLFATRPRWRAFGGAIAGLGLIFFGLQLMQGAFAGISANIDLSWLGGGSIGDLILLVLIGMGMTALMQSSSASLAVVLTAVATGLLSLESGAAAVIGANIGTTITALLAVLKATPSAKRVAGAHVIFNLLAATAAFALMGLMLTLVAFIQNYFALDPNPAVSLAIFHTLFNLAGVLLMIPISARLANWLDGKFVSTVETLSRPQYLDNATAESPDRASRALMLEEKRLLGLVRDLLVSADRGETLEQRVTAMNLLIKNIDDFISHLSTKAIPREIGDLLQEAISINLHASNVLENRIDLDHMENEAMPEVIRRGIDGCVAYLQRLLEPPKEGQPAQSHEALLLEFQAFYEQLLESLKAAARAGTISMRNLEGATRYLATLRRVVRQYAHALDWFDALYLFDPKVLTDQPQSS